MTMPDASLHEPLDFGGRWPAFAAARARHGAARVPFLLKSPRTVLGSVGVPDLPSLAAYPDAFEVTDTHVVLHLDAPTRDARLDEIHRALRAQGRIAAWRDEPYPLRGLDDVAHGVVERAASRFWGLLTLGAHGNGYLADANGRPTHLWIARRSRAKPTDPGMLDNLVGGGVPAGQSPDEALVREGFEEAGLSPEDMRGRVAGGVLLIDADIPEGRQVERLHVHDLPLPASWRPRAVDGEVEEHLLLTIDEALARAAAGEMTTDATLATLDFALRHGMAGPETPRLAAAMRALAWPCRVQTD